MSAALRRHSITWQLTLLFTLVSSGMLALLGVVTLIALDAHFESQDRDTLRSHLRPMQALVASIDEPAALASLPGRLQPLLAGHDNLAVAVRDPAGRLLFSQHFGQQPPPMARPEAAMPAALTSWDDGDRAWRGAAVAIPTALAQLSPVTVTVALDMHHHDVFIESFRRVLIASVLLCAIGCAVGGGWAVRRGLRPLTALRERAAQVDPGKLDVRMPVDDVPTELVGLSLTLNQMLARLEDAFRRLSQFSSDIAHELRTPISNLMTQTQVTLSQPRAAADYRETLASNAEELERLGRTVSDMLFLAKTDHGLLLPSREPVELRAEVQALFDFYEALALDADVSLSQQGAATVVGDRLMLRRAIGNLLSNALQHTPAGGRIEVVIGTEDGRACVTVRNDGAPISAAALPHLFDRFYRVQADRSHAHSGGDGAGLGLAITQAIVQTHGGDVAVHPQAAGNAFVMRIPLDRAVAEAPLAPRASRDA